MHLLLPDTAFLFLDFHVDVCAPGGRMVSADPEVQQRFADARERAGRLLTAAREASALVLHVGHGFEPGYPELEGGTVPGMARYVRQQGAFVRGTPGAEFVSEVAPLPGERVIWKHSISPFPTSDLAEILTRHGVTTVVLCGVVTHYVVLATAVATSDRGLRTVIARDACASGSAERHAAALDTLRPLTEQHDVDVIVEALTGGAIAALARRQLVAYNAADIDAFCACYHPEVRVLDADGGVTMEGLTTFRERYGAMFARFSEIRAEVPRRVALGDHCVDYETWSRVDADGTRSSGALLVRYSLRDDRIGTVQFLS